MNHSIHRASRRALAVVACVAASRLLAACASESALGTPNLDGGSCHNDFECAHNLVCREGACAVPTGRCNPEGGGDRDCYASARCDTSTTGAGALGYCTFSAPPRQVFTTESRITLESPNPDTPQSPEFGFSMRWQPPRGLTGAVTVAAVLDAPPQLDASTGRLTNWRSVKWIWSSAEPGSTPGDTVTDGTVPLRFGHLGVTRDGALGPRATSDRLPVGKYYWLVYVIQQGAVAASSVTQWFVVGSPTFNPTPCAEDDACTGPGELPETHACIGGVCIPRCASDFDCRGTGFSCALGTTFPGNPRRGAYCRAASGDGGV